MIMHKIMILFLLVSIKSFSQRECLMPEPDFVPTKSAYLCGSISENEPIKYVRVAFDVFQRTDGSGNFYGGDAILIQEIESMIKIVNKRLGNLKTNIPDANCTDFKDTRIRLLLQYIHFYKNDALYNYTYDRTQGTGYFVDKKVCDSIYSHIILANDDINDIEKHNTLHIMFLPMPDNWIAGRAS